ncbi:hypothetical protein QF001_002789 [Paraburkholderia youngii]
MSSSTPASNSTAWTAEPPAAPAAPVSPWRRTWLRFKSQKLGYWSLIVFVALFVVSLAGELIANDKPLIVRYDGHYYFPILKEYPETQFGGDFPAEDELSRSVYPLPPGGKREFRGLRAEPQLLRHDRLFRRAAVSGAAERRELARYRSVRA